MRSCRESTPLLGFSSGGCSAPTRGGIQHRHLDYYLDVLASGIRRILPQLFFTASSSELFARLRNWSEGDTQLRVLALLQLFLKNFFIFPL